MPKIEDIHDGRLGEEVVTVDLPFGSYLIDPRGYVWFKDDFTRAWIQVTDELLVNHVKNLADEKRRARDIPKVESGPAPDHYGDF